MEYRHRCVEEQDKNELRRFSFTCDPKFIGVHNSSVESGYKDEQLDARERSLALMKYHHRFGAKKVVQLQAMKEYEVRKKCFLFLVASVSVSVHDHWFHPFTYEWLCFEFGFLYWFSQKQKTEPLGNVRKASEAEVLNSGEGDSDTEFENENPYTFLQSMNQLEATKRIERTITNTNHPGTSETGDTTKGSPGSTHLGFSPKLCIFGANSDSTPCTSLPLPLSKYCKTHILNVSG